MQCEWCRSSFFGRSDRRYCGSPCRQAAFRARERAARQELEEQPPREDDLLGRLNEPVEKAILEPRLVGLIAQAATTNWRASAWLLERKYGERWALRPRPTAEEEPEPVRLPDPFAEADEIAARRRRREGLPPL